MKNKINYLISIITSIIICNLIIPIKITGGFYNKTYYGKTNIIYFINKNVEKVCSNCNKIEIIWYLLIFEFILVFFIFLFILKLFDKIKKKDNPSSNKKSKIQSR